VSIGAWVECRKENVAGFGKCRFLPEAAWPGDRPVKLETMGLAIDTLTEEQVTYATDYSAGT
jgi:hypothetical protein